jgi:hypothetical protein
MSRRVESDVKRVIEANIHRLITLTGKDAVMSYLAARISAVSKTEAKMKQ